MKTFGRNCVPCRGDEGSEDEMKMQLLSKVVIAMSKTGIVNEDIFKTVFHAQCITEDRRRHNDVLRIPQFE